MVNQLHFKFKKGRCKPLSWPGVGGSAGREGRAESQASTEVVCGVPGVRIRVWWTQQGTRSFKKVGSAVVFFLELKMFEMMQKSTISLHFSSQPPGRGTPHTQKGSLEGQVTGGQGPAQPWEKKGPSGSHRRGGSGNRNHR